MCQYKSITKKEFCIAADISNYTFRQWQNQSWHKLQECGQTNKSQRILTPAAVKFLCEFYCVYLPERK